MGCYYRSCNEADWHTQSGQQETKRKPALALELWRVEPRQQEQWGSVQCRQLTSKTKEGWAARCMPSASLYPIPPPQQAALRTLKICHYFFWLCCAACGILVPWLGIKLNPLHWKLRVLGCQGSPQSGHLLLSLKVNKGVETGQEYDP